MASIWDGERVRLRGVEPEDWAAFRHFDEESADACAADILHPPPSTEGYDGAIEEARREASGDSFRLAIEALDGNTLVGSLNTVAPAPRAGRFGYGPAIGRDFQRRGYGREAITLLARLRVRCARDVIAVLLPGSGTLGRYSSLVAKGLIRLKATTTSDLGRVPQYSVPADTLPLDLLLAARAEDDR